MKKFPKLFHKSSKGKIEQWEIFVKFEGDYPTTIILFGEYQGKIQRKENKTLKGLNIGKINETTTYEQAVKEAQAKWDKQRNKGYVESLKDAQAGIETLDDHKGGSKPMLAHDYEDYQNKIVFPVYIQPKLDGMRCLAVRTNGEFTLWSRERNPILSCPHIIKQLKELSKDYDYDFTLDGELYVHEYHDEFEKIMKAVKKQFPTEESKKIELHIYDCVIEDRSFQERLDWFNDIPDYVAPNVHIVKTLLVPSHEVINQYREVFEQQGYEGLMVRDPKSLYKGTRSSGLLKYKIWRDAEFEIVDVVGGKDLSVIFICLHNGEEFRATKTGVKKDNQKFLTNKKKYIGKMLNVKYFKMTKKNKVPKFGQAIYIRDEK